jgi:uncharacterized protein DUF3467
MPEEPPPDNPTGGQPSPPPSSFTQEVRHSQVGARLPENVGRGVFSTGVLILQGPQEFALDFVQRLGTPHQVVARVILPAPVVPRLVGALQENLQLYQNHFGTLPALRTAPPPAQPPAAAEIYAEMKFPDEMLAGVYANGALIRHTQAEFCLDFITNLFPRPVVSSRVYLAAAHVPGFLQSLNQSFQQYQQKLAGQRPKEPPEPRPET